VEDFVEELTRGNPGSVKAVLASVILALASYQLILAAIGYRKLPIIDAQPAFFTHRASGHVIAILFVLVALACLAVFGFEDDHVVHGVAGIGAVAVLALKVSLIRSGRAGWALPYLGVTLFTLIAVTWLTVTPEFLSGED
jgi:CDP-diglyceride synthetase